MQALPVPIAVARWVLLSALQSPKGVDYEKEAVSLLPVPIPEHCYGWYDIARHSKASAFIVPSHVVYNELEVWC